MTHQARNGNVRDAERSPSGGPAILIIGTLDTKSVEIAAIAGYAEALGASVLLLDTSGRAHPSRSPGALAFGRRVITRGDVAAAAGTSSDDVEALPRGEAVTVMRLGVARHVQQLH